MRCSVVFGDTLRLLVINISSSFHAINTAAYYQQCVTTCETVAVVHRRPCLQHLPVTALTHAVKPDIGSELRFLPTPPAFDAPVKGFPSEYCYTVWLGKTRVVWLLATWWWIFNICLFVLTWSTNLADTQTDRRTDRQTDTAWRLRPRLHSIARQKWQEATKPSTAEYGPMTSIKQSTI